MSDTKKVRYLKTDRGRYFYQRRVPQDLQTHLGMRRWQIPCGNVSYSKAVQMVVTWTEEHDALIQELVNPEKREKARVETIRNFTAEVRARDADLELDNWFEMSTQLEGEKKYYRRNSLPRPWQAAAKMLLDTEAWAAGHFDSDIIIQQIDFWIEEAKRGDPSNRVLSFVSTEAVVNHVAELDPNLVKTAKVTLVGRPLPPPNDIVLDGLREAYDVGFGPDRSPPSDPDDKDEYDFIKRKLERKISELSPDPNTLTSVMQKYCDFNSIRFEPPRVCRRPFAPL